MKKIASLFLVSALTTTAGAAYADQCAAISQQEAENAAALIEVGSTVLKYCEPCGDAAPTPVLVESVEPGALDFGGYWGTYVNGDLIDLAYTFVPSEDGRYRNLSVIVGCPADDVSESIDAPAQK